MAKVGDRISVTAAQWYRQKAVQAQRRAAERSAEARSYVFSLQVYRSPPEDDYLMIAKGKQEHTALGYNAARAWVDAVVN